MKHILITGTTSGIGLGILREFHGRGFHVTSVNRRRDEALERRFPGASFRLADVRDRAAVKGVADEMAGGGELPDILVLGAGINKADNADAIDAAVFQEVLDTNLTGVMNGVSAWMPHVRGRPTTFVTISSTSNLFPNPKCLAYHASKLSLHKVFRLLDRSRRAEGLRFKSVILGPVATHIYTDAALSSKLQAKVRGMLTVSVEEAAPDLARFILSERRTFYYPKRAVAVFLAAAAVCSVFPGIYTGASSPKRQEP